MNEALFKPRGLYALVVAYKHDATKDVSGGDYDAGSAIARYTAPAESGWKKQTQRLRTSSGKDVGGLDVGAVAPLVFPGVEEARKGETEEEKGKWKKFEKFMGDYGDRRAQAIYVRQSNSPSPRFVGILTSKATR